MIYSVQKYNLLNKTGSIIIDELPSMKDATQYVEQLDKTNDDVNDNYAIMMYQFGECYMIYDWEVR